MRKEELKLLSQIASSLTKLRFFVSKFCSLFFFNDTATTEIYTLSLHDALPISSKTRWPSPQPHSSFISALPRQPIPWATCNRSEEHTSELQSQSNLVCRLLLEKKKSGA